MVKRTFIAATALVLAGTLAGCGGDDEPKADPAPTQSASPSVTDTTPEPKWDNKFSPAQIRRYEAARDRWLEYIDRYNAAARRGVDTPGVEQMFEDYTMVPLGEHSRFLDLYVRGGARQEVAPEILWTSAEKIGKDVVDLNYCVDHTNARLTVNGRAVEPKPPLRKLVTVRMRNTAKGWLKLTTLHTDKERSCTPTAP